MLWSVMLLLAGLLSCHLVRLDVTMFVTEKNSKPLYHTDGIEALQSDNHLDDRSGGSVLDVELVHFYRCQGLYAASETERILHENTISAHRKLLPGTYRLRVCHKHYQDPSHRAFSWENSKKRQRLVVNQHNPYRQISLSLFLPRGIKYDDRGRRERAVREATTARHTT